MNTLPADLLLKHMMASPLPCQKIDCHKARGSELSLKPFYRRVDFLRFDWIRGTNELWMWFNKKKPSVQRAIENLNWESWGQCTERTLWVNDTDGARELTRGPWPSPSQRWRRNREAWAWRWEGPRRAGAASSSLLLLLKSGCISVLLVAFVYWVTWLGALALFVLEWSYFSLFFSLDNLYGSDFEFTDHLSCHI